MANLSVPFIKFSLNNQRKWYKGGILQRITIQHWYYRDNRCNDFELIPTNQTQEILKKYNLRIKPVGNEYLVIALKEFNAEIISQMLQEKLEFYIELKNPYVTNFTALLEKQHPRAYYFFKQETQGIKQEQIVMVSNSFEWTFTTIEPISQLTLYDTDGDELKLIDLVANEDGSYHVSIDMNTYELGIYSLASQDQSINIFISKVANTPSISSLFGLLQLNLNNDIVNEPNYSINTTTEQLQFYPRKIRWHYNLYKSDTYKNYNDNLEDKTGTTEEQLDWDYPNDKVEVEVSSGNTTVRCIKQGAWGDRGAYTSNIIPLEEDAFFSGTVSSSGKVQAIGLSLGTPTTYHYNEMHVGLLLKTNGKIAIIEEGQQRKSAARYESGDTFCIVKVGSWIYYEKNEKVLGRFRTTIEEEIRPLIAFKSNGASLSGVHLHRFSSELPKLYFGIEDNTPDEVTTYLSDRWLPFKQRPKKILELTLATTGQGNEITIPLRNPSALELENQIDINI